jgi:exodeoxyribonuclease-5
MRKSVNRAVRKLLGKEGLFSEEEKLICTKNYWEKDNIENSLTNGTVGFLRNTKEGFIQPYSKLKTKFDVLEGSFTSESGLKKFVKLDKVFLKDEEPMFTFEQRKYMNRKNLPKEFTYAYAITGHKSQGSEWDKVVIFEEPFPYGEDHVKWLYTCVTRAKKSVILVRP